MGLRSVLLFPQVNMPLIHDVRRQYDALAEHIPPHISLVFPFESDTSDETVCQVVTDALQHVSSFDITLNQVAGDPDNGYVWLVVDQGSDEITALHDTLYQSPIFMNHLRQDIPYKPHMTIAQGISAEKAYRLMAELPQKSLTYTTRIEVVSVEHILNNDDSEVFFNLALR